MKALELKVPPLPLALVFGLLMWAIDRWLPMQSEHSLVRNVIALAMFGLAAVILVTAVVGFRTAKTTVDPMHPETASAIVTWGIYRFIRNPMYLALLLALIAWEVFLGNVPAALMPLLLVAYMNRFQISPEERALTARFGAPYETYLRSVRRWL
jgi:protein-S-isoprenylcysteine O-methyltransferase Ste14